MWRCSVYKVIQPLIRGAKCSQAAGRPRFEHRHLRRLASRDRQGSVDKRLALQYLRRTIRRQNVESRASWGGIVHSRLCPLTVVRWSRRVPGAPIATRQRVLAILHRQQSQRLAECVAVLNRDGQQHTSLDRAETSVLVSMANDTVPVLRSCGKSRCDARRAGTTCRPAARCRTARRGGNSTRRDHSCPSPTSSTLSRILHAAALLDEIEVKAVSPRPVEHVEPVETRHAEAAWKALAAPVEDPLHGVGARNFIPLHAQIFGCDLRTCGALSSGLPGRP